MYHFVYKTVSPSGKFYIGRHSTLNLDDGYFGSGRWVRSIKDKSRLRRFILDFCDDSGTLLEVEKVRIAEHLEHPDCMNFNNSSCGFGSGDLNYRRTEEGRAKSRERALNHNPMAGKRHTEETLEKLRVAGIETAQRLKLEGYVPSDEARAKISAARKNFRYTDEQKKVISERRKEQYKSGERVPAYGFKGKTHSDETRAKMKESRSKTEKMSCPHCNLVVAPHIMSRWHGERCKHKV